MRAQSVFVTIAAVTDAWYVLIRSAIIIVTPTSRYIEIITYITFVVMATSTVVRTVNSNTITSKRVIDVAAESIETASGTHRRCDKHIGIKLLDLCLRFLYVISNKPPVQHSLCRRCSPVNHVDRIPYIESPVKGKTSRFLPFYTKKCPLQAHILPGRVICFTGPFISPVPKHPAYSRIVSHCPWRMRTVIMASRTKESSTNAAQGPVTDSCSMGNSSRMG